MAAVLAFVAFVLALIFHIIGGSVAKYWVDAELIGLAFVALELIVPRWHRGSPS
jgi:hypothetical protein